MHRLYENNEIVIFWNSDKCFHSTMCIQNSPKTFDVSRKPWIQLGHAENPEVWNAVEQCPSGALSILYRHGIKVVMEPEKCRSVAYDEDKPIGECDYRESDSGWCIYHTVVDPEYGGKGIAKRLVYAVIEVSERKGVSITATCSYAVNVLGEQMI